VDLSAALPAGSPVPRLCADEARGRVVGAEYKGAERVELVEKALQNERPNKQIVIGVEEPIHDSILNARMIETEAK